MRSLAFLTIVLLLAVSGCTPPQPLGQADNPYPLPQPIALDTLVHLPTGTQVTTAQMMTAIATDHLVYVGETHDNPASHRLQQQVIEAMHTQHGNRLAVGMEMFHADQQPVLDRWIGGELEEKQFIRQLDWYQNWRIDYAYYRDILNLLRQRRIPIVALNATAAQKQQARQQVAQTTQAPLDPYYQATLRGYFAGHDAGSQQIDTFIRIQSLWDDTMAQSVVSYLSQHPDHRMVILAGGNHVRYGFGIPRRVFQQLPLPYSLIGNEEIEIDPAKQAKLMDVELPSLPLLPFHYLLYNRYEALPPRMQLGVRLEQQAEQVVIVGIVEHSLAERYQLQSGDIIQQLAGQPVQDVFDVIYAISQLGSGDQLPVTLLRDDQALSLTITFD